MNHTMRVGKNALAGLILLCGMGARVADAQEAVIYNFQGYPNDGVGPAATLLRDAKGNLFGTTQGGGVFGGGAVFEVSPVEGGGWTEKVIHSFSDALQTPAQSEDGSLPMNAALIEDSKGNLYGTTPTGGANPESGTAFELSPAPDGSWVEKVIYNFGSSSTDGSRPYGSLVFDAQGNLYGTTRFLHLSEEDGIVGYSTVFKLSPSAEGNWTGTVIYTFGATSTDGVFPVAGLAIDSAGDLYGTTSAGGSHGDEYTAGTVFKLIHQNDGSWTESILHNFDPSKGDGSRPIANILLDSKGNLYSTTLSGGNNENGTVFELSPATEGAWTEKLFLFTSIASGYAPQAGVTMDAHGNLYGTTGGGGSEFPNEGGIVFKLVPQPDGSWMETVLHNFPDPYFTDGYSPTGGVILDSKGNLYGTAGGGGTRGHGTVFEIGPDAVEPPTGTMTTLVASPSTNLLAGESITLTATVVPVGGTGIPDGTVTFADPAGGSETVTLDQTGTAVYNGVVPGAGTYSVFARYNGANGFPESQSATITETVSAP